MTPPVLPTVPPTALPTAIGIFGGSFDPVHLGHLWIAEAALGSLPIEQVRWMPAATSPLKKNGPVASNLQRLTMLRLALSGVDGHVIDTRELDRDGLSYTVDTLEELTQEFPDRRCYLIIGADSLNTFDQWKQPDRILKMCTLAVVARGGMAPPDYDVLKPFASNAQIADFRNAEIRMPPIEISSQMLRERIRQSKTIRFFVPHPVDAYIRHEGVY